MKEQYYREQLARFTEWVTVKVGKKVDCKQVFGIHLFNEQWSKIVSHYNFNDIIHVELNHRGNLEGYMLHLNNIGIDISNCSVCDKESPCLWIAGDNESVCICENCMKESATLFNIMRKKIKYGN